MYFSWSKKLKIQIYVYSHTSIVTIVWASISFAHSVRRESWRSLVSLFVIVRIVPSDSDTTSSSELSVSRYFDDYLILTRLQKLKRNVSLLELVSVSFCIQDRFHRSARYSLTLNLVRRIIVQCLVQFNNSDLIVKINELFHAILTSDISEDIIINFFKFLHSSCDQVIRSPTYILCWSIQIHYESRDDGP